MRSLVALLLCGTAHANSSVFVEGRFTLNGVGVDDVVDLDISAHDQNGVLVLELKPKGVVVVDGLFAIEVNLSDVADEVAAGDIAFEVRIDDTVGAATLGPVFFVSHSDSAARATIADNADSLGGLTAAELVSTRALALAGGPALTFGNVSGQPEGLDDGDQGNVDELGTALALVGNELRIANASIDSALVVDNSIDTAAIANGTVTTAQMLQFNGADFAPATLTGDDFQTGTFALSSIQNGGLPLFQVAKGCAPAPEFATTTTCVRTAGCSAPLVKNCVTGVCDALDGALVCANTFVGQLLFPR